MCLAIVVSAYSRTVTIIVKPTHSTDRYISFWNGSPGTIRGNESIQSFKTSLRLISSIVTEILLSPDVAGVDASDV